MLILSWKMLTFYWESLTDRLRKGQGKVLPRTQRIVVVVVVFVEF